MTSVRITLDRARKHWHLKQGLAGPREMKVDPKTLARIVATTGWPRTLGGVDVYVAMRARVAAMKRADLDRAVVEQTVQVLPAVRGCIYLVPRSEVALLLRVAHEQVRARNERELEKVDVKPKEIEAAGKAIVKTLAKGPLTTDALRKALPEGAVRSLGDLGKKVGISSTLPIALRELEFEGEVERSLEGGRLDTERYAWRLPAKNPFQGAKIPDAPSDRNALVARSFFSFAGPATVKDFAAWTALSQRDARAAIDAAGLAPVTVDGVGDAFVVAEDLTGLAKAAAPSDDVRLLSFEDNYLVLHGGPALFTKASEHDRVVPAWGTSKPSTIGEVKHMALRSVLIGDELAGVWEIDLDRGEVVTATFAKLDKKAKARLDEEASAIARFLIDEMGHAKSFTLDTADSIRERADLVRKWAKK